ncbi:MAG: adenylate kinase family protein [Candidatus Bathyarchaeia archaeon]|nr:adenylate kinase family protein [Candidatus Bathyarchaeota archaeon]
MSYIWGGGIIRRIIIITGTPGVGKSSVSKALASKINAHIISIGNLVKEEKLYSGVDRERDTLIADTERVSRRVKEIISKVQGDVIVEGHFAVDVVPPKWVSVAFVLRRDPEELRRILEGRSYSERKIMENLAAEILDVCLYEAIKRCGVKKVCEIDVTSKSVEDVVGEILDVLNGVRECRVGIVDWLGKLEAEGKLDEYLKDF